MTRSVRVTDTLRRAFRALRLRGIQMTRPLTRTTTIAMVVTPTMTFPTDFSPFAAGGSSSQRCTFLTVWKKGRDLGRCRISPDCVVTVSDSRCTAFVISFSNTRTAPDRQMTEMISPRHLTGR